MLLNDLHGSTLRRSRTKSVETETDYTEYLAPGAEKLLQDFRAPACENAAADLNFVIETGVVQHPHNGVDSTRFGVIRAENQPPNARVHERTGAHCARFNCSKQV